MSKIVEEVIQANRKYVAEFGEKGKLPAPPGRRFAVLTCMDARLDPAKFAGLAEGDAHVLRNAGGRVTEDVIRSLVISYKLLGTREWFVVHHTGCGMTLFTDEIMRKLLASSLEPATYSGGAWRDSGKGPGSRAGEYINWLTIQDPNQAVIDDVEYLRAHPLVPRDIAIHGYIYDVATGKLNEVTEATRRGAATAGR